MTRFVFSLAPLASLALGASLAAPHATAQADDGAPHIAVVQQLDGSLALEFEVQAGLDLTSTTPVLTLDVSDFSPTFGGFRTLPLNTTASPNDDLGFVSEVEGAAEEGASLDANIVLRLLSRDDAFRAFLGVEELFATPDAAFGLGSAFDTHPSFVLASNDPTFSGFVTASFEVFDLQSDTSVGFFDVRLDTEPIPEPTTAAMAAALGAVLLRRRSAGRRA